MANIMKTRIGQNIQGEVVAISKPINWVTGSANFTDRRPVIEKTPKITATCQLEVTPQCSFEMMPLNRLVKSDVCFFMVDFRRPIHQVI